MSHETDMIRQHLLDHPQGLTQSDLSRELKINRVSLAKYLATMVVHGELEYRIIGKANLYTLTKRLPMESILWQNEDHVINTDNNGRVTQIDERTAAFFGCPVEQMIGKPIGEKSSNQFFTIDGSPLSARQMTETGSLEFIMYSGDHITYFNRKIRKVTKKKGSFPSDESLLKILLLIVMNDSKKCNLPLPNWGSILNQLHVYFGERLDAYLCP